MRTSWLANSSDRYALQRFGRCHRARSCWIHRIRRLRWISGPEVEARGLAAHSRCDLGVPRGGLTMVLPADALKESAAGAQWRFGLRHGFYRTLSHSDSVSRGTHRNDSADLGCLGAVAQRCGLHMDMETLEYLS